MLIFIRYFEKLILKIKTNIKIVYKKKTRLICLFIKIIITNINNFYYES